MLCALPENTTLVASTDIMELTITYNSAREELTLLVSCACTCFHMHTHTHTDKQLKITTQINKIKDILKALNIRHSLWCLCVVREVEIIAF